MWFQLKGNVRGTKIPCRAGTGLACLPCCMQSPNVQLTPTGAASALTDAQLVLSFWVLIAINSLTPLFLLTGF